MGTITRLPDTGNEKFEWVKLGEYNICIGSKSLEHVALHSSFGGGSMFLSEVNVEKLLGMLDPEKINTFGANRVLSDEPIGYNLVDKVDKAMLLPDAALTTGYKTGVIEGVPHGIEVPAVSTSMTREYFETCEATILLYPPTEDLQFTTQERIDFVKSCGKENILFFASAFPGAFDVRGMSVPPASLDKGMHWDNNGWCAIIPS